MFLCYAAKLQLALECIVLYTAYIFNFVPGNSFYVFCDRKEDELLVEQVEKLEFRVSLYLRACTLGSPSDHKPWSDDGLRFTWW